MIAFWLLLYFSSAYYEKFQLPIQLESDFELWVGWSHLLCYYKIILAFEFFVSNFMLLLVSSRQMPMLEILFETISKARFDLLSLAITVVILLIMTSTGFHIIFGANEHIFSTFVLSVCSNYRQLLG